MAIFLPFLVFLLALTGRSSGTYCICKDGLSDSVYQKDIDYACGAGADCTQIQQNGPCYNPNTVKDHCNYAVNSYFQRKGQATGSCDFSGSATPTPNLPNQQNSACVYPSSASPGGSTTTPASPGGIITTPTSPGGSTTTPTTPTTVPTTPTGGTAVPTTPTTGTTPTTTPSGTTTGTPPSSVFGLGPASITPSTDNTSEARSKRPSFWAFKLTLLLSSLPVLLNLS